MARGARFDYRQIEKLKKQLEKIQKENEKFCEECAKYLAATLLGMVKRRTPSVSGELRRNWTIGELQKVGNSFVIEIINPTGYASYVEFGHRTVNHMKWVPGKFMLKISEEKLEAMVPALLERKISEYLRRYFDV